jgi:hypothetical protein
MYGKSRRRVMLTDAAWSQHRSSWGRLVVTPQPYHQAVGWTSRAAVPVMRRTSTLVEGGDGAMVR